jgi:hypothetical protein
MLRFLLLFPSHQMAGRYVDVIVFDYLYAHFGFHGSGGEKMGKHFKYIFHTFIVEGGESGPFNSFSLKPYSFNIIIWLRWQIILGYLIVLNFFREEFSLKMCSGRSALLKRSTTSSLLSSVWRGSMSLWRVMMAW